MSAGNTPGPWWLTSYGGVRDEGGLICSMRRPSHYLGQEERYEREGHECKANAKLIASAPDLLAERDRLKVANAELVEALEEVCRVFDRRPKSIVDTVWVTSGSPETLYDHCRAALAKHQGAS